MGSPDDGDCDDDDEDGGNGGDNADGGGGSPAPIDRPVLAYLRDRFAATRQVETAHVTDAEGHIELVVALDGAYYPGSVTATLSVRWYTNDDFAVHYHEERDDGDDWHCRWDRHPNPHNTREHRHPPPDAPTPGEDATWPDDHRAVLGMVLDAVEQRIEELWDRN